MDRAAVLHDLSQLLNTGLSREQLRICVELLRGGESPEGIAAVVKELRKEAHAATPSTQGAANRTASTASSAIGASRTS